MRSLYRSGDVPPHLVAFLKAGQWRNRTVAELALDRAITMPDANAFIGNGSMTFAKAYEDAAGLAASLLDLGLRAGDVISFMLPNWPEAGIINLAAAMTGLVVNPIVPIYRDAEVTQMLTDSKSCALFVAERWRNFDLAAMVERIRVNNSCVRHVIFVRGAQGSGYEKLIASGRGQSLAAPDVSANSIKLLLYTSGTSGKPKGVLHSHNTLTRVIDACAHHWGIRAGEVLLTPSPVTHISGYVMGLEMPFLIGTRTLLMETWNGANAAELIDKHGVVGTMAATPFLTDLIDAAQHTGTRLPSLRFFACGGAAVPADLIRKANAVFTQPCAFRVFGCSEAPLVTLGFLGARSRELAATTDGEIVDYAVRVTDSTGSEVPQGAEGELLVRGPAMFVGYADGEQTREALTDDGYFRTGDVGRVTQDRAIIVTGRTKDIIIRGGENISPKEIEDVLLKHPAVAEAAVVAMPVARLGESICAFVVPRAGATVDVSTLATFVLDNGLAKQKCPEHVAIIEALPRTASGKIRKDLLRETIRANLERDQHG